VSRRMRSSRLDDMDVVKGVTSGRGSAIRYFA
jgi:hypothetical protein